MILQPTNAVHPIPDNDDDYTHAHSYHDYNGGGGDTGIFTVIFACRKYSDVATLDATLVATPDATLDTTSIKI